MRNLAAFGAAAALALSGNALAAPGDTEATSPEPVAFASEPLEWRFRVLLGKREIGFHEFRVDRGSDRTQVEINAQFDVRVLLFKAYSYTHRNIEVWEGGCLAGIESVTDDNGKPFRVRGRTESGAFVFDTRDEQELRGPECTRSFAYWNPDFLDSTRLLNSQTGELVDVSIDRLPDEVLEVKGEPVAARRYALEMDDGTISLWYSADTGQWLALEAPAPGGRVLRYEPVELPLDLSADERLAMN